MLQNNEQDWRRERLAALVERLGGRAAVGRQLGFRDGAYIGHMLSGERPITEKFVAKVHALQGFSAWFVRQDSTPLATAIPLDSNPDYPAVRRVRIKASAGVNGYAVEHMDEDGPPIVFRADWFRAHGYRPDKLVALRVCGQSMEPSLYEGDLIVVNTQQTEPKDGRVFVVLYEGVVAVKRLVRDAGAWWLESDNADKRAFPRKACTDETTVPVGEVVYKQSERI